MPPTAAKTEAEKLASVAESSKQASLSLQSLVDQLKALADAESTSSKASPAKNWWRARAGRFKADPTFAEFVEQVRAARQQDQ